MGLLINIDMVKLILLLAFFCVGCSDAFNEGSERLFIMVSLGLTIKAI